MAGWSDVPGPSICVPRVRETVAVLAPAIGAEGITTVAKNQDPEDPERERQMAEVNRLLRKLPHGDAKGAQVAMPGAGPRPGSPATRAGVKSPPRPQPGLPDPVDKTPVFVPGKFSTWMRVLLVFATVVGMSQWPYAQECGWPLTGYLFGVAVILGATIWVAKASWESRAGLAHIMSLVMMGWSVLLVAEQLLPRIGYAKTAATWTCVAPEPALAPATEDETAAPQPENTPDQPGTTGTEGTPPPPPGQSGTGRSP